MGFLSILLLGILVVHCSGLCREQFSRSNSCTRSSVVYMSTPASSPVITLENVKNIRDLSSAFSSSPASMLAGKIYRTGCVSKATSGDFEFINNNAKMNVFIDLRSPTEIEEDENIRASVYDGFKNFYYDKKTGRFDTDIEASTSDSSSTVPASASTDSPVLKQRFFVSLIDESVIKKGIFKRLRKRTKTKALLLLLLSALSKRAEKKVRSIFINCINAGGLKLLNEILLDNAGKEIVQVLKLLTQPQNFPAAIYCTAGKDRTGLISMFVLSILGASQEEITADYVLSDSAYKEINDKKAMVASLKQTDVDPELFLGAKAEVIEHVISYITKEYGTVCNYLNKNGFDKVWRDKLRRCLVEAPGTEGATPV